MKRFYNLVSHSAEQNGFSIFLDGKPVKTGEKKLLLVPNEALADSVVQEWAGQVEEIVPDTMPITQILNTKIDRVSGKRAGLTPEILKYLDTDLLCYHAPQPPELATYQNKQWKPWLDWFAKKFGVALEITTGLGALSHPEDAHDKMRQYVEGLDDDHFTILQMITPLSGSIILAMAFVDGAATPEQIQKAAFAEEDFKSELCHEDEYGRDPMIEKKQKQTSQDLNAASLYLKAL